MERFSHVSPMLYRYISEDSELFKKYTECQELNSLKGNSKIVSDSVLPRLDSLNYKLSEISDRNREKKMPLRIDLKQTGVIGVDEIFINYAKRIMRRIDQIKNIHLNEVEEVERNERFSDLIYCSISTLSIEANIANDVRDLFRSEVHEYAHADYASGRVGSSTMPHKMNPAEYEQIVSLWKRYIPSLTTAILFQKVDHQGDSTNDGMPFLSFEVSCALSYATGSLTKSLENLEIKEASIV